MGFTPVQVREMTLDEFGSCISGWNRAQGHGPAPELSDDDYDSLVQLGQTFNRGL